jgi:hypothetical protein
MSCSSMVQSLVSFGTKSLSYSCGVRSVLLYATQAWTGRGERCTSAQSEVLFARYELRSCRKRWEGIIPHTYAMSSGTSAN